MADEQDSLEGGNSSGTKRDALRALAGAGLAGLSGCYSMRGFPSPQVPGDVPISTGTPFKPVVRKSAYAPALCIDAHTHFFNGNDVTVKGYLAGPVVHELKSPLKELVLALAPLADRLVEIAPTAAEEFKELNGVVGEDGALKAAGAMTLFRADAERQRISTEFYRVVRGTPFEAQFNAIKRGQSAKAKTVSRRSPMRLDRRQSLRSCRGFRLEAVVARHGNFTSSSQIAHAPMLDRLARTRESRDCFQRCRQLN